MKLSSSCCACYCCCFYPKYKRKVDNIYPRQVDAPLVKNEVDKLQYYVTVHPEKLSKIGECLYRNLKRGLNGAHRNRNYVKNTIEAVEKILIVITPQNLNYFAPYYLKIIQKLLEQRGWSSSQSATATGGTLVHGMTSSASGNNIGATAGDSSLEYQKMAATLFQKFCDKEASNMASSSVVNYQLSFDQFVYQFSSMCYNTNREERVRAEIRSSGLQCLSTMVKRLVFPDDNLRAGYIWDNMDKIVPALLFIMHESFLVRNPELGKLGALAQADLDRLVEATWNASVQEVVENCDEFNRYLYGTDFYENGIKVADSRTSPNSTNNNNGAFNTQQPIDITRPDSVRIHFTKSSSQLNESRGNTPEESNVMITTTPSYHQQQSQLQQQQQQQPEVIDPDHEAKLLLKSISSKADYTTIGKIVVPILAFLDDNKPRGWELAQFVRCIFLIVMYNVKQQHAIVIKELIKHIDSHRNSSALLKCYILRTINVCIGIAAMQSVGTTGQIIEIFTNLLKHLNYSVEKAFNLKAQLIANKTSSKDVNKINQELNEEQKLQKEIIKSMGQFTSSLPDYAKNDVFMFIARQINSQQFTYADLAALNSHESQQQLQQQPNSKDQQLRAKYFECLYEICTRYRPLQLSSAFTSLQFFDDILRLTLVTDWASRRKAHECLHLLLDKYQLLDKIRQLKPSLFSPDLGNTAAAETKKLTLATTRNQTYLSQLDLTGPGATTRLMPSREDMHFMRKNGRAFLAHLNEALFLTNNRRENFESIYLTVALFLIGLFYDDKEFLADLVRFGFHVQELALLNHEHAQFSFASQCSVHKFVCAYFLLLAKYSGFVEFEKYASAMCDLRRKKELFKFAYPEYILLDSVELSSAGGNQSEMETEFKRELAESAKEYTQMVKGEEVASASTTDLAAKTTPPPLSTEDKPADTKQPPRLAAWLFDKQTVEEALKQANYPITALYAKTNDFSLSVSYLQQIMLGGGGGGGAGGNVATVIAALTTQTALRYRSPYSCSYDCLTALSSLPQIDLVNANNTAVAANSLKGHSRGYSGGVMGMGISPNLINTPRRSVDADSNADDDTSYDSTSQFSIDYEMLQQQQQQQQIQPPIGQKIFFLNEPMQQQQQHQQQQQATVSSLNAFKQQYAQQQDLASFETIKRVLFNGNGCISGNNSAVGGQTSSLHRTSAGSSTVGGSKQHLVKGGQQPTGASDPSSTAALLSGGDDTETSSMAAYEAETSMRIISEFKQKPFDELKQALIKSNQTYMNADKYQQVFELISREIHPAEAVTATPAVASTSTVGSGTAATTTTTTTATVGPSTASNTAATTTATTGGTGGGGGGSSYSNISLTNLKNTSISSMSSNQSAISSNNILVNGAGPSGGGTGAATTTSGRGDQSTFGQKQIPLNDIDFPKLFMF